MATRDEIDQLDGEELQAVREVACKGCEGAQWFSESDCRYVCPQFKVTVEEYLAIPD